MWSKVDTLTCRRQLTANGRQPLRRPCQHILDVVVEVNAMGGEGWLCQLLECVVSCRSAQES
jgi:hypothetical protein